MENPSSPVAPEPVRRRVYTRTPGKKSMKWDTEADQQLLLAILVAHEVKVDSEAVASRLGEHCTPRAVVERLKKLKKQAIVQDDNAPSDPMTKAPPARKKKKKKVVLHENSTLAADRDEKSTQAQVSATRTSAVSTGNGFGEADPIEESSIQSISAGDIVEGNSKSGGRITPVNHKQAIGNSYAQPAISSGPLLLDKPDQNKFHKVVAFSSSKIPQPFLDK